MFNERLRHGSSKGRGCDRLMNHFHVADNSRLSVCCFRQVGKWRSNKSRIATYPLSIHFIHLLISLLELPIWLPFQVFLVFKNWITVLYILCIFLSSSLQCSMNCLISCVTLQAKGGEMKRSSTRFECKDARGIEWMTGCWWRMVYQFESRLWMW